MRGIKLAYLEVLNDVPYGRISMRYGFYSITYLFLYSVQFFCSAWEHGTSTKSYHLTLFWARLFTPIHVFPAFSASFLTVLLRVSADLPAATRALWIPAQGLFGCG